MGLPYSKLPPEAWRHMGINAGVLLSDFDVASGAVKGEDIIGATDGPIAFSARPGLVDLGAGLENCPRGVRELLHVRDWEVRLQGAFISADTGAARRLIALADASDGHIVPRGRTDASADFSDIWYVFDYGADHGEDRPGLCAIRMKNALNTGGFRVQARAKDRVRWPFAFTAHVAVADRDDAGFEVYLRTAEMPKEGSESNEEDD